VEYKTVLLEKKDGVAVITLNRPDKLNVVTSQMRSDFFSALDELATDDAVRVVIVTGAGRAFCAGNDISTFKFEPEEIRRNLVQVKEEPQRLLKFEKPIIGAVNGVAAGEGSQWLLMFDLMVASIKASIAWPATRLGMCCPYAIIRLASEVGRFRAKDALMTARFISAEEAYQWGLVTRVVPPEQLMEAAMELANQIKKMPPMSLKTIKEAVNRGLEGYEYSYQALVNLQMTEDFKEGVTAFLEKREPQFRGK